jgi:hypothetical protein
MKENGLKSPTSLAIKEAVNIHKERRNERRGTCVKCVHAMK